MAWPILQEIVNTNDWVITRLMGLYWRGRYIGEGDILERALYWRGHYIGKGVVLERTLY